MRKIFLIWLLVFQLPVLLSAKPDKGGNIKIGSDLTVAEGIKTDHAFCIGGDTMVFGKVKNEDMAIGFQNESRHHQITYWPIWKAD